MIQSSLLGKNIKSNASLLLFPNKFGGFFLFSLENMTKYQGFFFKNNNKLFKSIDSIKIENESQKNVIHRENGFEIKHTNFFERFSFPEESAIIYETNSNKKINFTFDCREAYDMKKWGRSYSISKEDNALIVHYKKVNDNLEQLSDQYDFYTVILSKYNQYEFIDKWVDVEYSFDKNRNDSQTRAVYTAFSIKTKKAIIVSSFDKEKALEKAREILSSKIPKKKIYESNLKIADKNLNYAYNLSIRALLSLKFENGYYAGLPWFFQFWTRDIALSSKAIAYFDNDIKKILINYINQIRDDGLIDNIMNQKALDSIDGSLLVFHRIKDLLHLFDQDEQVQIAKSLLKEIELIKTHHSKQNLIVSNDFETWMDTTPRPGARIEIQALFLSNISFLKELSKKLGDEEIYRKALSFEIDLKNKVKSLFYRDNLLFDGIYNNVEDRTIRPNLFLAYYFYPDLLEKKEWNLVFDNALDRLWLDWGGLSTIDKNTNFNLHHSGIDNRSYHNGDSWFFLNNLVALVLFNFNRDKYNKFIEKILSASTDEILNKGIFGYHAELSSAEKNSSNGCLAQLWSSALYVELINTLFG